MSYCRWSCDDFRSDVYTYAHIDGTWTTHVAGQTRNGVPIGLAHDGETFKDEDPAACRATLLRLRDVGYHVPAHAIERLDEEIAESADNIKSEVGK
jgi:hypothetical protein